MKKIEFIIKLSILAIVLHLLIFFFLLFGFCILHTHILPKIKQIVTYQPQSENLICSITAYTNRPKETNADNNHTAIMEEPIAGYTCAVSQDLLHWLGGHIYIKDIGLRKVNDLMNERFEKSIDLYIGTIKQAEEFGRQKKQTIFLGR